MIDSEDRDGVPAMMGTGGIIVLDDTACVVDMTRFLLGFFAEESCGKCTPCREGNKQMLRILTRICRGQGTLEDLTLLRGWTHATVTSPPNLRMWRKPRIASTSITMPAITITAPAYIAIVETVHQP